MRNVVQLCLVTSNILPRFSPIIVIFFLDVPTVVVVVVAHFPGREGGGCTQQSFMKGSSSPRSKPLPFYIPFSTEKGILFVYLLLTNCIACENSRLSY